MFRADRTIPFGFIREYVTRWDALALLAALGLVALLTEGSHGLLAPLSQLAAAPISLDPRMLPGYAARTTLRMFAALGLSLVFTLTYATWAAKCLPTVDEWDRAHQGIDAVIHSRVAEWCAGANGPVRRGRTRERTGFRCSTPLPDMLALLAI